METVALFLQTKANSCLPFSRDFDLFGRSSFNRYYYALYLQVRSTLGELNASWATEPHASIPRLLRGQILVQIKDRRKRALRLGDAPAVEISNRGVASANELSTLMNEAYSVRITADYNPHIPVLPADRVQGRFQLNAVHITTAHNWVGIARTHGAAIKRAWSLPSV